MEKEENATIGMDAALPVDAAAGNTQQQEERRPHRKQQAECKSTEELHQSDPATKPKPPSANATHSVSGSGNKAKTESGNGNEITIDSQTERKQLRASTDYKTQESKNNL